MVLHYYYCIDTLKKMFTRVIYSEKGTNRGQKEENTYMMFLEYLDKCEEGNYLCNYYVCVTMVTSLYAIIVIVNYF